jgi:hypothetical protein
MLEISQPIVSIISYYKDVQGRLVHAGSIFVASIPFERCFFYKKLKRRAFLWLEQKQAALLPPRRTKQSTAKIFIQKSVLKAERTATLVVSRQAKKVASALASMVLLAVGSLDALAKKAPSLKKRAPCWGSFFYQQTFTSVLKLVMLEATYN